jgi:hypothetical protein
VREAGRFNRVHLLKQQEGSVRLLAFRSRSGSGRRARGRDRIRHTLTLEVGAAAETADQVSDAEGNRGSRVRALLDGCVQDVFGRAGPLPTPASKL